MGSERDCQYFIRSRADAFSNADTGGSRLEATQKPDYSFASVYAERGLCPVICTSSSSLR